MVADDIELARALVAGENVAELRKRLTDAFARVGVHPRDRRACLGVSGGEDRYLVAGATQGFGEQRDDRFDAAIAGRWHREPDRA
jgi:NH3-dependent NAD+ synthetase